MASYFLGVKPNTGSDVVDSSNVVSTFKFPTLKNIAGQTLAGIISEYVGHLSDEMINGPFWNEGQHQKVRELLQTQLPAKLRSEFFQIQYIPVREVHTDCPNCFAFKKVIKKASWPEKFIFRWLLFRDDEPGLIKDFEDRQTLAYLRDVPTGLTKLIVKSEFWTPAQLKACLNKQLKIKTLEVSLLPDKNLSEFANVLIEVGDHYSSLSISSSLDNNFWTLEEMAVLLNLITRISNLHDLSLGMSIDFFLFPEIWDVISNLPCLSKLTINALFLESLPNPAPLKNLKTLIMKSAYANDVLNLEAEFPSIKNLVWSPSHIFLYDPSANHSKITELDFCRIENAEPINFLSRFPNLRSAKLRYINSRDELSWPPFELQHLTRLEVGTFQRFTMDQFKVFFTSFPNVVTMSIEVEGLSRFNELEFIQFLEDNKSTFAKLRKFNLRFDHLVVNGMCTKSILAFLQNSNIVDFEFFNTFPFIGKHLEDLKALAVARGLKLLPIFPRVINSIYITSGDPEYWPTCEQGYHTSFGDGFVI